MGSATQKNLKSLCLRRLLSGFYRVGDEAAASGKLHHRHFGGMACSISKEYIFLIEIILEHLTKPLNVSPADGYAGKREKRLVDISTAFVADT